MGFVWGLVVDLGLLEKVFGCFYVMRFGVGRCVVLVIWLGVLFLGNSRFGFERYFDLFWKFGIFYVRF